MTREWAEEKTREMWEETDKAKKHLIETLSSLKYRKEAKAEKTIEEIRGGCYALETTVRFLIAEAFDENGEVMGFTESREYMDKLGLSEDISKMYYDNPTYRDVQGSINLYERFIDSETMHFDGDIIITDPCYVTKDTKQDYSTYPNREDYFKYNNICDYPDYDKTSRESVTYSKEHEVYDKAMSKWRSENETDWEKCNCGYDMKVLGLNCITHDTLYGDWSCGVFNINRKKPNRLGSFCADAGMVGVFDKSEVDRYNPDFEKKYLVPNGWCACLIKDFFGDVTIKVIEVLSNGNTEYEVIVVGDGINRKTRRPVHFESRQTGF